ncbi:MAG: hypothetical protein QXX99_06160 [Candidatus Bathyarchaeia archaeon]
MEKISVILAVINILVAIGPITSMVVMHVSNPIEVIIPPELQLNEELGSFWETLQTIELINVTYAPDARTLTLLFSITSRLNDELDVNDIEADVVCVRHDYLLGHAHLISPVALEPGRTAFLTVQSQWTADAEQHIRSQHAGEGTIDISLVNFTMDIEGVMVQIGQPIILRNVPIGLP